MSSAVNHMRRSHRSEHYKPGRPGGPSFSRSKYHGVRSVRPGFFSTLRNALLRRKLELDKKRREEATTDGN